VVSEARTGAEVQIDSWVESRGIHKVAWYGEVVTANNKVLDRFRHPAGGWYVDEAVALG
jgi:hypothetical protein